MYGFLLCIPLLLGWPDLTYGKNDPNLKKSANLGSTLILLDGTASLVGKDSRKIRMLSAGDVVLPGQRFRTGLKARAALKFADGTFLRLDEITTCELKTLEVDKTFGRRNITIYLFSGNVWLFIPATFKGKRGVVVEMPGGVVEADRSTFRIGVYADKSTILKVYRGSVYIHSPDTSKDMKRKASKNQIESQPGLEQRRGRVKKRWSYFVKPMHQILVRPDGTASKPFRFMRKPDTNQWVLWNQQLDKEVGN